MTFWPFLALLTIQVGTPLGPQGPGLHHSPLSTALPFPFQGGHAACCPQPCGPACLFLWWRQGWRGQVWGETCFQQSLPLLPIPVFLPLLLPGTRRLRLNSPRFGCTCFLLQHHPPPSRAHPWFPACSPSFHHLSGPWHPHPQDCAPVGREQPWVSGFGHGALEVEESSPQAPAGFSL